MTRPPAGDGARTRNLRSEPTEPIPWRILQDERISFRALGVLGHLLSLPDNWRTSATRLAAVRKEGRDAVETALGELDAVGYLARRRVQYRNGTWGWVWIYGIDTAKVAAAMTAELLGMVAELHPKWVAKNLAGDLPEWVRNQAEHVPGAPLHAVD